MATFSFDPQITDEWLNALTLFLIPGMKLVSFHCIVVLQIADLAKLALQAVGVFSELHRDNHISLLSCSVDKWPLPFDGFQSREIEEDEVLAGF